MKLSIIIPVYNEEETIKLLLERVKAIELDKEIIIVDDGSTDKTGQILDKVRGAKIVTHKKNMGKGSAIRTGLKHVTGEIVLLQDADLETDPGDYYNLIRPIIENKTKVVYGSRFLKPVKIKSLMRYLAVRILTILSNLLYKAEITDMATGYKVFKTEVIKGLDLKAKGFDFCSEVTAKLRKRGHEIHEVPIAYFPRSPGQSKLNWKDGFHALYTLVKYKFLE